MSKPKGLRLPCFSHTGKAKRRFENLDEAALWINDNGFGGQFRVYECPDCGGAHLSAKRRYHRKNE